MVANKIKVSGIAVTEGTSRNNIKYTSSELNKFAPTLNGRPIIKDHEATTDNVIGKVKEGKSIDGGQRVMFEGWVKEDGTGIVEKIKDGRISEVSIGAMCEKLVRESEDSDVLVAKGMTAMELSTTPTPGVKGTSISQSFYNYMEKDIDNEIESYMLHKESDSVISDLITESNSSNQKFENDKYNYKEVKMEQQTQEKTSEQNQASVNEALELKVKLAESEKTIADMKEVQRQESVATYKAKCADKKLTAQDASNMTMETIKALIAVVESIPSVSESMKVDAVQKIDTKTKTTNSVASESTTFDNYVVENSTFGGLSFYKFY